MCARRRTRLNLLDLVRSSALEHRVGVGFPEDAKLLHFYTEFLTSPNFYTFSILAHFFSPRCARDCLTFLELVHMAYLLDLFRGRCPVRHVQRDVTTFHSHRTRPNTSEPGPNRTEPVRPYTTDCPTLTPLYRSVQSDSLPGRAVALRNTNITRPC